MSNILLKISKSAMEFKADIEIEEYFKEINLKIKKESLKKGFCRGAADKKKVLSAKKPDFCIICADFSNEKEFKITKKITEEMNEAKFYFIPVNSSKEALIKVFELEAGVCVNKISDLGKDNFIKKKAATKSGRKEFNGEEFKGTRVLIVDDIEENINILKEILSPFNFDLTCFCDPKTALEAIKTTSYDIIFLDIIMPEIDGFKLAKKIRTVKTNSKAIIIFVSALGDKEKKIKGYSLSSLAYIEKPLDPRVVQAQVYGILKVKKLREEIVKEKENFIAMLTHDLKTPIRAQIQAINLILDEVFGKISKKQREILTEIMASNKYLQFMTENVLSNYKEENGKFKIKKGIYNIKETLEGVVENLKYVVLKKGQRIEISFKSKEVFGEYDEIEIKRVLTNLIVNASDFTEIKGEICVSVEDLKGEGKFKITVSDKGGGIKDFNLLFQKYSTSAKIYKKIGTGLGLYICKTILSAHSEKIYAKNNKSGGADFIFTLEKAGKKTKIKGIKSSTNTLKLS